VPLTLGHGEGAALQFEVELTSLDQLDQFRNRGVGSSQETGDWMHAFSEILTRRPASRFCALRTRRSPDKSSEGLPGKSLTSGTSLTLSSR